MSEKLYPQQKNNDRPWVCHSGEAFDPYTAMLMRQAGDELNTLDYLKYTVIYEDRVAYDNEGKRLEESMVWIRIAAPFVKTEHDLIEFWTRVDELRRDDQLPTEAQ